MDFPILGFTVFICSCLFSILLLRSCFQQLFFAVHLLLLKMQVKIFCIFKVFSLSFRFFGVPLFYQKPTWLSW